MVLKTNMKDFLTNLLVIIKWALVPYKHGSTYKKISKSERDKANKSEKLWGNQMIGATNNGQWTTKLGEYLVKVVLTKYHDKNVTKPKRKKHYEPDWETDDYMWEVKTRNWTTSGTAGEKVLGVPYKYSDIPILYGKPLKIVCVGYQEWELTHGNTRIFGDDISESKKNMLKFWKSIGIEFVKFSDLIPKEIKTKIDYDIISEVLYETISLIGD